MQMEANSSHHYLVIATVLVVANAAAANLVAHWPFDEDPNNAQGNHAFNGILVGNATICNEDTAVGAGCLKIDDDGNSVNYVDIVNSVLVGGVPEKNTVVAWYKYADISGNGSDTRNFVYETDITYSLSFSIRSDTLDARKHVQWWYNTTSGSLGSQADLGPAVDDGQWHHLAMVFSKNPSRIRFYHDGVLRDEASPNSVGLLTTPRGFHIGNHRTGDGSRNWDGYIDDVAIFDGELPAGEVAALYSKSKTITTVVDTPDPTGDDLMPFVEASWTIAVVPDPQYYVKYSSNTPLFEEQMRWIRDNKDARNIEVVLFEGDLTDDNGDAQWAVAKNCISILDGNVPYVLATGNHDYGVGGSTSSRATRFNDYFHAGDNPLNDPNRGGILKGVYEPNSLENAYYEFVAQDGRKVLIIVLEFGPRNEVVEWANTIASRPEYAGHTAILLTHAYTYTPHVLYDWARYGTAQVANPHIYSGIKHNTNDGEELWEKLVRGNDNLRLTFSGHVIGPYPSNSDPTVGTLSSVNELGHEVHQMMFNAQTLPCGGNGWLRLVEIQANGTVQVKTYSPVLDSWRTDGDNQFIVHISLASGASKADFDADGNVNLRDFAVFSSAWLTDVNDPNWNQVCDLSEPNEAVIDMLDLAAFADSYSYAASAP